MPRRGNKTDLLAAVPLFSSCTKRELQKISSLTDQVTAQPGEELTTEGSSGTEFFVIEEGTADVVLRGSTIATIGPGDFFGEMALLDHGPRSATVRAASPMSLYVIGAREFGSLIDEVPHVSRKLLQGLARRLRSLENAPKSEWSTL
jgi:CRP/FNR family transcriptional regulator, cyclic AMP receptor protein